MILSSFFLIKNNIVYFKEQIWFPNRKCNGKNKLCFDSHSQQGVALSPSFSLNTLCRWLTVGDSTLCAGLTTSLSTDSKTYTLLKSAFNDTNDADIAGNADDADNGDAYNRVIGIAQLKAFSSANKEQPKLVW